MCLYAAGLDYEHSVLVISALARFHATSFAFFRGTGQNNFETAQEIFLFHLPSGNVGQYSGRAAAGVIKFDRLLQLLRLAGADKTESVLREYPALDKPLAVPTLSEETIEEIKKVFTRHPEYSQHYNEFLGKAIQGHQSTMFKRTVRLIQLVLVRTQGSYFF